MSFRLNATYMTYGRSGHMASPEEVAQRFMHSFDQDEFEIRVGKVRVLLVLKRLAPGIARKLVNGQK